MEDTCTVITIFLTNTYYVSTNKLMNPVNQLAIRYSYYQIAIVIDTNYNATHKQSADSGLMIIPYKVINSIFTTLCGIVTW